MDSANYSLWEDVPKLPDSGGQDDRGESTNQAPKYEVKTDESYRHQCEVRWLLNERTRRAQGGIQWLRDYLQSQPVKARREKLELDIRLQWIEGNRGDPGVWYRT